MEIAITRKIFNVEVTKTRLYSFLGILRRKMRKGLHNKVY